jgi:hypothetical protein
LICELTASLDIALKDRDAMSAKATALEDNINFLQGEIATIGAQLQSAKKTTTPKRSSKR